jgi:hypothetical protein
MREIDKFYAEQQEPIKSCFLALRQTILSHDQAIVEAWKYRLPFFLYRGEMFCYLWADKKTKHPYIGMVAGNRITHSALVKGNRTRMKILPISAERDLPVRLIRDILKLAIATYSK